MFIYPYRIGSESVNQLKAALGAKLIRLENSKFKGSPDKNVINWGNSETFRELNECNLLNTPERVKFASNKLNFFNAVHENVSVPDFTVDRAEAYKWIEDGKIVCVREKLTGHSGEGLVLLQGEEEWGEYNHGDAKLYVKYIPKRDEFRVHVFKGEVFDVQRKGMDPNVPKDLINFQIRNAQNGFIFVRNEDQSNYPKQIYEEAIKSIEAVGLDFGAVDIIWNEYRKTAYVLEVNTAPGLTGTTLTNYINKFSSHFNTEVKHVEGFRKAKNPSKEIIVDDDIEDEGLHEFDRVFEAGLNAAELVGQAQPAINFRAGNNAFEVEFVDYAIPRR